MCSTASIVEAKRESASKDVVKSSHFIYLEDRMVKTTTPFAKNFLSKNVSMLFRYGQKDDTRIFTKS